jgi:hypothetical protein
LDFSIVNADGTPLAGHAKEVLYVDPISQKLQVASKKYDGVPIAAKL